MRETIDMRGAVTLQLSDADGRLVQCRRYANRIVKTGRLLVAHRFGGVQDSAPVSHIAVGTDGTAASDDNEHLFQQRAARKNITDITYLDFDEGVGLPEMIRSPRIGLPNIPTPNDPRPLPPVGDVVKRTRVQLTAVFDFGEANGAGPLREAGVFTAAEAGVMYNRVTFADVTKTDAFKLTVLWDIVF